MRYLFSIIAVSSLILLHAHATETEIPSSEPSLSHHTPLLPWTEDLSQALISAKSESKPIYIYFSGSTWCIWCKRMDNELHNSDEFRQKTIGNCLFVRIDLPAGGQASDEIKNLLAKYHISSVPTVILLSSNEKEITRFRYQKITPEAYANLFLSAVKEFKQTLTL